jgi:DNA transposition AAA+ family ATPase
MLNSVLARRSVVNEVRSAAETVAAVVVDAVVAVCKTNEENAILTANLALTRVALNPLRNVKVVVRTIGEASKTKSRASWSLLSLKRLSRERLKSSLLPKQLKSSK